MLKPLIFQIIRNTSNIFEKCVIGYGIQWEKRVTQTIPGVRAAIQGHFAFLIDQRVFFLFLWHLVYTTSFQTPNSASSRGGLSSISCLFTRSPILKIPSLWSGRSPGSPMHNIGQHDHNIIKMTNWVSAFILMAEDVSYRLDFTLIRPKDQKIWHS